MPTEVEVMRDLARAYWANQPIECPKHRGALMTGSFVHTTFADHVFLTCTKGRETIMIQQRPKQVEYQPQSVEGMVENIQRGDNNLCFRCQSKIEVATKEDVNPGVTRFTFTCVRCYSWGTWTGLPALAKIGSAPTAGTQQKKK